MEFTQKLIAEINELETQDSILDLFLEVRRLRKFEVVYKMENLLQAQEYFYVTRVNPEGRTYTTYVEANGNEFVEDHFGETVVHRVSSVELLYNSLHQKTPMSVAAEGVEGYAE